MKSYNKILLIIPLLLFCFAFQVLAVSQKTSDSIDIQQTNSLIVKYKNPASSSRNKTLQKENGILTQLPLFPKDSTLPQAQHYYLLTTNKKFPLKLIIKNYQDNEEVEWIVPDTYIYPLTLKNGGFDLVPTKVPTRIPIRIPTVISTTTSSPTPKKSLLGIAVLDSGIIPSAVNPSTVVSHSSSPIIDDVGHGTYITQVIQTRVPEQSQIIPFKVIGKEGYGKLSDVLRTLQYIKDHPELHIKLINMSFASERIVLGTDICKAYEIFNSNKDTALYISAAGNDNQNIVPDKDYPGVAPASCNGFIAVGSIKKGNTKTPDSNYGKTVYASLDTVTLPKLTIDKSACKTTFCSLQGTSIATALFTSELANKLVNSPATSKIQLISSLAKLPSPQASTLAKKTIQFTPIPSLKIPTPTRNIGGAEIITKETTVEKVVTETNTQVIVVTPTPTRSQSVSPTSQPAASNTPPPTSKPSVTTTPVPIQPTKMPTSAPTSTPRPAPTATPFPLPTPTSQPTPTEVLVCRDDCIDYRDECPVGTVDAGSCPTNSRFKLCACTK